MSRKLPAVALLATGALLAGCGGGGGGGGASPRPADPGLTIHDGAGFSVGYPKAWKPDPRRTVFRGAELEVFQPDPAGGQPKASWSVFTEHVSLPLDRLVDGFLARSKRAGDFTLIERKKLEGSALAGHDGYVIRKAYSTTPAALARPSSPATPATRATPATPATSAHPSSPPIAAPQPVRLRQDDLFVRVSSGTVADVRIVVFADRYDAARPQIDAVINSFRVET